MVTGLQINQYPKVYYFKWIADSIWSSWYNTESISADKTAAVSVDAVVTAFKCQKVAGSLIHIQYKIFCSSTKIIFRCTAASSLSNCIVSTGFDLTLQSPDTVTPNHCQLLWLLISSCITLSATPVTWLAHIGYPITANHYFDLFY